MGKDGRSIATSSQDAAHKEALLFDAHILKPNVNVRVPFSLHAGSGLVALPLDREGLAGFDEAMAEPERVAGQAGPVEMPRNDLAAVKRALVSWGSEAS